MKPTTIFNERGFTLTELLVASAVLAVVMGGLFTMLSSGQQMYATGSNQVEAQQTLRHSIARMAQEIRDAGYCPTCGNVPALLPFAAITAATTTSFTIQNDWSGNWDGSWVTAPSTINNTATVAWTFVSSTGVVSAPIQRGEQIIYSYSAGTQTLSRREMGVDAVGGVPIATQISSFSLTFLDAAGNTVALPTTTGAAGTDLTIRSVVVSVVAQSATTTRTFQAGRVQAAMTDTFRIRNR